MTLYTQYSTQWDARSHVGEAFDADQDGEEELFCNNGYRGGVDILGPDDPKGPCALNLGTEKMAETCVQGAASWPIFSPATAPCANSWATAT